LVAEEVGLLVLTLAVVAEAQEVILLGGLTLQIL
jgi:hypothetical protein